MRVIQDSDDEAEDLEADIPPLKSAAADASAKQAGDNNESSGSTGNNCIATTAHCNTDFYLQSR
jgi:hypothetical protein